MPRRWAEPGISKAAPPVTGEELEVTETAKYTVIVFDLETTGLDRQDSVLSCTAIKYAYTASGTNLGELERFDRYYFSVEAENPEAIRINGLTRDVIRGRRAGKTWPEYFRDETGFQDFCRGADLFVAHNIQFDAKFVSCVPRGKRFCTMRQNTRHFGKYPKLSELASYFNIPYESGKLHGSAYDAEITGKIFEKMIAGKLQTYI
jgi:DNA polymerase-3 subunit epsilon